MKIAVIFPSRGLMFSKTAEELLTNLKGISHKIYFSHKRPIPECFEFPTENALKDKDVTHLWFVEDDMILPPHTLRDMLAIDKAVVTVNYPTTNRGDSSILTIKDRIVYGGTGCTLVKRGVFDELKRPFFRSDIVWIPKNYGDHIRFTAQKKKNNDGYGYHDVNFFLAIYNLDIPVHKLDYTIGQRKLVELGKSGSNNGAHVIEEWHKVKKDRFFTLRKNLPVLKTGPFVEVCTPSGNFMAKRDHARKLVKAGLATIPPKRAVVLDDSEIL